MTDIEIGKERQDNEKMKDQKMKDQELINKFKEKYQMDDDCKVIFTDGSKQNNNLSAGIRIVIEGKEIAYNISIDKRCSIYTAELLAIEKAMDYVEEIGWEEDILILSDSQSANKDIVNNKLVLKRNEYINQIRERIDCYESRYRKENARAVKVVIGWIPGHKGIRRNKLADGLAKEDMNEEKDERMKVPCNDWEKNFKD